MLVGGLEHFLFSHIFGIIIPIDFPIFQRVSNHQPVWHGLTYATCSLNTGTTLQHTIVQSGWTFIAVALSMVIPNKKCRGAKIQAFTTVVLYHAD